jgi:hypothetical protein
MQAAVGRGDTFVEREQLGVRNLDLRTAAIAAAVTITGDVYPRHRHIEEESCARATKNCDVPKRRTSVPKRSEKIHVVHDVKADDNDRANYENGEQDKV